MSKSKELPTGVEDSDQRALEDEHEESLTDLIDSLQRQAFNRRFDVSPPNSKRGRAVRRLAVE
jgi:hypothetical protein